MPVRQQLNANPVQRTGPADQPGASAAGIGLAPIARTGVLPIAETLRYWLRARRWCT